MMRAKNVRFDVTYIDLRNKPDWFLKISPHGKVPVLLVDKQPLFESNAIAEYLDEVVEPRLHPADPIKRARNRAWTDFAPSFASAANALNYAKTSEAVEASLAPLRKALQRLEDALAGERDSAGVFFNGAQLSLVDAAYAPFLQRLSIVEGILNTGVLDDFPNVRAWRDSLLADERVSGAVPAEFPQAFNENLRRREAHAWTQLAAAAQ